MAAIRRSGFRAATTGLRIMSSIPAPSPTTKTMINSAENVGDDAIPTSPTTVRTLASRTNGLAPNRSASVPVIRIPATKPANAAAPNRPSSSWPSASPPPKLASMLVRKTGRRLIPIARHIMAA